MRDKFYTITNRTTGKSRVTLSLTEAMETMSGDPDRLQAAEHVRVPLSEDVIQDAARRLRLADYGRAVKKIYTMAKKWLGIDDDDDIQPPQVGHASSEDIADVIRNRLNLPAINALAKAVPAFGEVLLDAAKKAGHDVATAVDAAAVLGAVAVGRILGAALAMPENVQPSKAQSVDEIVNHLLED